MTVRDRNGNVLTVRNRNGDTLTLGGDQRSPLTDPLTPLNVQPVGHTGFGDPVFSDEFLAGSLNTDKWLPWYPDTDFWNTTVPGGHKSNTDEPQAYDPSGITFDENGMIFTMRNESTIEGLDYTSGMVCSYPSFNVTHGYFEARMQLANVDGSWPAFWMMPTNMTWPPEIDIMENWGRPSFNTETSHTYHDPQDLITSSSPYSWAGQDLADWHTFGVLWEPGRIRWYCDGNLAKDLQSEIIAENDRDMYIICNLAGDKGAEGPVPADMPFSIRVGWIRAWSLPS